MSLISQRAYARHRGVTLKAVQKAIAANRITLVVEPGTGKLKIDPAIADAQWARNTDPDQQLRGNGGVLPVGPGSTEQPDLGVSGVAGNGGTREREELLRHKADSAELDAELKRLELAKRRGELVSLADEREVRAKRYRGLRDKLLGIADREAAVLAAERDPVQVHAVLTRAISQVLNELSDDARREADRGDAEPMAA